MSDRVIMNHVHMYVCMTLNDEIIIILGYMYVYMYLCHCLMGSSGIILVEE